MKCTIALYEMPEMLRVSVWSLIAPILSAMLFGCAGIRTYDHATEAKGIVLSAAVGNSLLRIDRTKDLPNLIGRRDIYGGKNPSGRSEAVLLATEPGSKAIIEVYEEIVNSNDNSFKQFWGIKPKISTTSSTRRHEIHLPDRDELPINGFRIKLLSVSNERVYYIIYEPNGDIEWKRAVAIWAERARQRTLDRIPMRSSNGVDYVSVQLNGSVTINCILDTGASEFVLPADVALTLMRGGTITQEDFLPGKIYTLADGSRLPSPRLRLRAVRVGHHTVTNIESMVGPVSGYPLLGRNVLKQLGTYTIDYQNGYLVFGDPSH